MPYKKHFILILVLTLVVSIASSQVSLLDGITLGSEVGVTKLIGESPVDFSGLIKEFDNHISSRK